MGGQGVLGKADDAADQRAGGGLAAHESEVDGHQQRKLEVGERIEEARHVDLEQDGGGGRQQVEQRREPGGFAARGECGGEAVFEAAHGRGGSGFFAGAAGPAAGGAGSRAKSAMRPFTPSCTP